MKRFAILLTLLLLSSCARGPIKNRREAMRLHDEPLAVADDLDFASLLSGIEEQAGKLEQSDNKMQFGPYQVSSLEYSRELKRLLNAGVLYGPSAFYKHLQENFVPLEVYGSKKWGQVFITSYYEPEIVGSKKRTKELTSPIYGPPKDMVIIRLDRFAEKFDRWRSWLNGTSEQKSSSSIARGRIVFNEEKGVTEIEPYLERAEIDRTLLREAPILAWVNPVDNFILQIQGSGTIRFSEQDKIHVSYASQNGYPYVALGKSLTNVIPIQDMTLQKIEAYLKSLPPEKSLALMASNPSYVFFQKQPSRGVTYFGTKTVPGRTIATDVGYFPKGALGFLRLNRPHFKDGTTDQVDTWEPVGRMVLDSDTGGAIRGAHRVDLFWGDGDVAKQVAGVMKQDGELYYWFPKSAFPEN